MVAVLLKRGLLLFWTLYFAVIAASNLCDALKAAGILPGNWRFASGNFALVKKATSIYKAPAIVNAVLFAGVVLWEGVTAALLLRATLGFRGNDAHGLQLALTGLGAGIALWAAFIVMDEIFLDYESGLEIPHLGLFIAQLATLLAVALLPESGP
jgi:hypothetical protein